MKRIIAIFVFALFLVGCSNNNSKLDKALSLRTRIASAETCSFLASVTAEYDDQLYAFDMQCKSDNNNELYFEILKPDTIAGITGKIALSNGELTFDNEVLAFEWMIDNRLSPVAAPWFMLHVLKSGYIIGCGAEENGAYIQLEDTYGNEKVLIDLYTDQFNNPIRADILWNGKRGLSVVVSEFSTV